MQPIKIIGLTGSIGMGKSTTAQMFRDAGIPVFDSDAEIHKLQAPGSPMLDDIAAAFPGVVTGGVLDRAALRERVFGDDSARKTLEAITHPALASRMQKAFSDATQSGADMIILDVPLLFEVGRDTICTKTIVVTAPEALQRSRVLARDGMTDDVLDGILAAQMPDADKRARADYLIYTDKGMDDARAQVQRIILDIGAL